MLEREQRCDGLEDVHRVVLGNAGPIDPLIELAQACWLNAQLHDDDIAQRQGLADAATRRGTCA